MKYLLPLLLLLTSCYPNRNLINSLGACRIDSIGKPEYGVCELFLSTDKYYIVMPVSFDTVYKVGDYVTPRSGKNNYIRKSFQNY